jgi:hypothetical protein
MIRLTAAALFIASVLAGTLLDPGDRRAPRTSSDDVLAADLHVHPYPGDGALPVWELRREAARRGIDVIAVTGHNNRAGLALGRLISPDQSDPLVLPGQEVTAPAFHLVAVGVIQMIDPHLPARDAIASIHAQGGVAIAAHPAPVSWRDSDPEALRALDGSEVAHPSTQSYSPSRVWFMRFFKRVQSINPDVAPIGSTDFHMAAPLGMCRTYVLNSGGTADGVLNAIRQGRTVAEDGGGRLFGTPEHVALVERHLSAHPRPPGPGAAQKLPALGALLALAALVRVL